MTHRTFVISDTHFGHAKALIFKRDDGTPMRDFPDVMTMDETMVERWNSVVRSVDKVYHLGDVVINRKSLPILKRLNGHKRLVRGNHDIFKTADYLEYFEEIYGVRVFPDRECILSHIPLHPESLGRFKLNIHGHLHYRSYDDPRYKCVSVEQTDYTPVDLDSIAPIKETEKLEMM